MIKRRVKISTFLTEREDRFRPEEANKLGLMRVNKIDFSGEIHLVEHKPTRTNMILVKKGDLLISGINAEKGAIAVYEYNEDAIATIHYSSYSYNDELIDIEYLKWFLKSNVFRNILIEQAGNGIKSELKAKKFLKLEIDLPELKDQIEFVKRMSSVNEEIEELNTLIQENESLLTLLRQSILQDAIQSKLTKVWREKNPDIEPASELLKRIKTEKAKLIKEKKIKKENPLPKIKADEIPFEIPKSWEWCSLQDLCEIITKGSSPKWQGINYISNEEVLFITSENVGRKKLLIEKKKYVENRFNEIQPRSILRKNDILMNIVGASIGRTALFNLDLNANINQAVTIIRLIPGFDYDYFLNFFNSPTCLNYMYDKQVDNARPNLSMGNIAKFVIPIPPLKEQSEIAKQILFIENTMDELQNQILSGRVNAEALLLAVLSEILGEENILTSNTSKEKKTFISDREMKYDSKTTLMELKELLQKHGRLHAEDLWKMSKFPEDIDKFYAELKKQIEQEKTIKESAEKGYLELA